MLQNKFNNNKTYRNWENFHKQRNFVTALKRKSINKCFLDRCVGARKSGTFWPTVRPFLTNKLMCLPLRFRLNNIQTEQA